jgi:hypothetical protein
MLQTLNLDVANFEFRCCKHVILSFVSRIRRGGILTLDVTRNTGRNMGQLSVVPRGGLRINVLAP